MKPYAILINLALISPSFSLMALPQPSAPFGFTWGMNISQVKKMPWVKKYNGNELVCNKRIGSQITKCVNSYAPEPLLLDGDYTLLFDPSGNLFQVEFFSSEIVGEATDKQNKINSILVNYSRYKNMLFKKYGEPIDKTKTGTTYNYNWISDNSRHLTLEIVTEKRLSIQMIYYSAQAESIIKNDQKYFDAYELGAL